MRKTKRNKPASNPIVKLPHPLAGGMIGIVIVIAVLTLFTWIISWVESLTW